MLVTITSIALILSVAVPLIAYLRMGKKHGKGMLAANVISFFSVVLVATVCAFTTTPALADTAAETAAAAAGDGMAYLAAALVTGLACIGAGIAVAAAASAALGAISENDKIMGKALIFVALAEGIALYGLLVTFMILGQM
ncbi:MAG TPA: ATPase [Candidatus Aphodoplasma excrementigallinarum]|uniref:ATP synthase F(0) sector subunit c n=1 Tax=Candidatus Aphodoplasma excrementigallinarum TaxID=2840673 RepID=A0A9D1NFX1_9FIRM|nr:ATPase [Candidatus Aphodoplasma excrementigallinarum]